MLGNQNSLLIAVSAKAQAGTLTVNCGTNPTALNAPIALVSHVGGPSIHSGKCNHSVVLFDFGLYRKKRLFTDACLPRWSRVAFAQIDVDDIIGQVA